MRGTTCPLCSRSLAGNSMGNKRHLTACRNRIARERGLTAGASVVVEPCFGEHNFGRFFATVIRTNRDGRVVVTNPIGGQFDTEPSLVSLHA